MRFLPPKVTEREAVLEYVEKLHNKSAGHNTDFGRIRETIGEVKALIPLFVFQSFFYAVFFDGWYVKIISVSMLAFTLYQMVIAARMSEWLDLFDRGDSLEKIVGRDDPKILVPETLERASSFE